MKKTILFSAAILLLCSTLLSQHPQLNRTLNWYYGAWVGTKFLMGEEEEVEWLPLNYDFSAGEACSCISDENGELLFYTNGRLVFNSMHNLMKGITNFDHLAGHPSAFQGALILPQPGNDSIYYIFTCDAWETYNQGGSSVGFRYSIVNMNGDGGLGEVIEKNIMLLDETGESVIATEHNNGEDFWLVSSDPEGKFFSWLFTESGIIGPIDEFQSTNVICPGSDYNRHPQFLKFSPRGDLIFKGGGCWLNPHYTQHTLIGFDNSTGTFEFDQGSSKSVQEIILEQIQDTTIALWVRATFSPAGNYLYTIKQMSPYPTWVPSVIERWKINYPINSEEIIQSREEFYTSTNKAIYMFQNTPHGNIFVSGTYGANAGWGNKIHLIHNPNSESNAYYEDEVYDFEEIYGYPHIPSVTTPVTRWCFNNTVEAWLYNDNDITTYKADIAKQKHKSSLFYPNPASDAIYIRENISLPLQINIYSLTGQLIYNQNLNRNSDKKINLQELSKGIYLIELIDNRGERYIDKIIVN